MLLIIKRHKHIERVANAEVMTSIFQYAAGENETKRLKSN